MMSSIELFDVAICEICRENIIALSNGFCKKNYVGYGS